VKQVVRNQPDESKAGKWRLAQAATMIEAAERAGIEKGVRRIVGM